MLSLYSIGELEKYNDVFDVDYFNKNIEKRLGFLLAMKKEIFYDEIYKEIKQTNLYIPFAAYLWKFAYKTIRFLKPFVLSVSSDKIKKKLVDMKARY